MDFKYVTTDLEEILPKFEQYNTFAIDLETTGLNPADSRILLCQIGFPDDIYVINTALVDISPILPFLASHRWRKIIQNAKFESKFFKHHHKTSINNVFDTYLAEILITSELSKGQASLIALAAKYADVKLDKDIRTTFFEKTSSEFTQEQLEYAAKDVEVLFPIMDRQSDLIDEYEMGEVAQLEFDLVDVVADMELEGTPIDQKLWNSKIREVEKLHEESRLRMHELIFDAGGADEQMGLFERYAINLNSPKQVKSIFGRIGINVDATNEREIALINHPAAQELLRYREYQKVLSSYGSTFLGAIHPFTGRIHADFQQIGTETGRFSCREPNLQQMPPEFRECVRLDDYVIVGADYSQIELRILAELSGDPAFLAAFNTGHDLHKSTASMMFNIPIDSVTKEQRFIAKTINFGISYGMGGGKLMDILNTEATHQGNKKFKYMEVKHLMERYQKAYKVVYEWLHHAGANAFGQGYSKTMMNRRRFYTRPDIENLPEAEYSLQVSAIKRKGANSPIQGTNADITKLAMIDLHEELLDAGYRAKIIIQVHDEIVLLAHKRQAEAVKEVVVESMKKSAEKLLKKVPVKADAYIAEAWQK